jgi:uncharacterized membrane protein
LPLAVRRQGGFAMTNEITPGASAAGSALTGGPSFEPHALEPGRGASWWAEGWRLFTPAVGTWLLIALVLLGMFLAAGLLGLIPVLGQLLGLGFEVVVPVFVGGLMLGCRALDRGNPLLLSHLFAGFSQRTGPLIILGIIYTGLALLIALIVFGMMIAIFGAAILGMITGAADAAQTGVAFGSVVVAVLLGILFFLLLLVPLVMAIWFAPALVMLGGMTPGAALKASFSGCLRNVVPFLVYGVVGVVLAVLATIPFGLGWFVLGPVVYATIYAGYCDIFEDKGDA